MGVDQRTGEGSKPRIPCVVSKSDRDHGTATTDNRNLGLTPAVTISRSNLSLSLYPILNPSVVSKSDYDHGSGDYGHRTLVYRPRVLFAVVPAP